MRKTIGILVCLLVVLEVFGSPTAFRSTSAYITNTPSVATTTAYNTYSYCGMTSSPSAISAANYASLNGEGGACYTPSDLSGPNRGRDNHKGDSSIGTNVAHSPVGDVPWILFILLSLGYIAYKHRKKFA